MTDISKARQALRDYARTGVVIDHTEVVHIEGQPGKVAVARSLGEMAGKAFMAIQDALTLLEKRREGHKHWEGDPASDTALLLIDDIEAAILKALES
jgi:hypothetical protein